MDDMIHSVTKLHCSISTRGNGIESIDLCSNANKSVLSDPDKVFDLS